MKSQKEKRQISNIDRVSVHFKRRRNPEWNRTIIPGSVFLIHKAHEQLKGTIRFALEFYEEIDPEALQYAVKQVQKRYPYFSVKIEKEKESFILAENDLPFVITADEKPVCLNSAASNGHLLAFAWKERTIWIDISHFICDGNGLAPLVKTLAYYYVEQRYGSDGIDPASIRLVTDNIEESEYAYPFPEAPIPNENAIRTEKKTYDPFFFEDGLFDSEGNYAYHLQIRQKDLMAYAKSNDGSPVSFICVMLYKTLMNLYPETEKDIVFEIPHEYRKVLGHPLSHDSLVRVFLAKLAARDRSKSIEMLNTCVRGLIILGSDESADIEAINGMLQLNAYMQSLPLEGKNRQCVRWLRRHWLKAHSESAIREISAGAEWRNTYGICMSTLERITIANRSLWRCSHLGTISASALCSRVNIRYL